MWRYHCHLYCTPWNNQCGSDECLAQEQEVGTPKIPSQTVTNRLAEWLSSGQEGKVARWTREPVTRRGTVCHLLTDNEDCSSWNINIPFIIVVHICAGNCLTTTRLCMWLCQLLLEWESELSALYVHSVLDNRNNFVCSFYTIRRSALAFEDKGIISTSRREITCNHRICTQIIEDMLICRLHRKLPTAWSIFFSWGIWSAPFCYCISPIYLMLKFKLQKEHETYTDKQTKNTRRCDSQEWCNSNIYIGQFLLFKKWNPHFGAVHYRAPQK
jgi:hypothetical protein